MSRPESVLLTSSARRGLEALDAEHLDARPSTVQEALCLCPTGVPVSLSIPTHEAFSAIAQRLALETDHTVVTLSRGTDSGRSSLLNTLTQLNFADVGARRPVTSRAAAYSWGDDAGPLLNLLGISSERRTRRDSALDDEDQDSMAGLVLLDVPDHDSVTTEHSLRVDRPAPPADILVWVVNSQKYADAALHDDCLRRLDARQEDMFVLINQVDTLPGSNLASLLDGIGPLLKGDGLSQVQTLPVSAMRDNSLDVARNALRQRVTRESDTAHTVSAKPDAITRCLRSMMAHNKVEFGAELTEETIRVLLQASSTQAVEDSVRAGLSRVLPKTLVRPEPSSRTTMSSTHSAQAHRTSQGLPSTQVWSLKTSVASPEILAGQTAEAVGLVVLPEHRQSLIDLLRWGSLLMVLGGVLWLTTSVVRKGPGILHRNIKIAPICPVTVGLLALLVATVCRRSRAHREAQCYEQRARDHLEPVVERGLSWPTGKILGKRRVLQSTLGLQPVYARQPCNHSPEPALWRNGGGD